MYDVSLSQFDDAEQLDRVFHYLRVMMQGNYVGCLNIPAR